jgi:hypothetical protein
MIVIGGWIADLPGNHPNLFSPDAAIAHIPALSWVIEYYPFALPGLLSAAILFAVAASAMLWLDEVHKYILVNPCFMVRETADLSQTLESCRIIFEPGRLLSRWLRRNVRVKGSHVYTTLNSEESDFFLGPVSVNDLGSVEDQPCCEEKEKTTRLPAGVPFSRIWTSNVLLTFLAVGIFDFHMGSAISALSIT